MSDFSFIHFENTIASFIKNEKWEVNDKFQKILPGDLYIYISSRNSLNLHFISNNPRFFFGQNNSRSHRYKTTTI